jgi:hypothetical protein
VREGFHAGCACDSPSSASPLWPCLSTSYGPGLEVWEVGPSSSSQEDVHVGDVEDVSAYPRFGEALTSCQSTALLLNAKKMLHILIG